MDKPRARDLEGDAELAEPGLTHDPEPPAEQYAMRLWYGGSRVVLVAYSIRDSGKLTNDRAECV